eukprot:TRINITY_DN624_c0_g1_i18.p2 TRINITY_DN624_c0_g1~~TRINITY_DN624_c0_g1_i18.p2  ORF type:complete len:145 (-),score=5.47 TRINITY_DN624_c0_g1_i18:534-968(-)
MIIKQQQLAMKLNISEFHSYNYAISQQSVFRNINRINKQIMEEIGFEEDLGFNCASFALNASEISNYEHQFDLDLTNPSSEKVKAMTNFINQGAEIEKIYIHGKSNQGIYSFMKIGMDISLMHLLKLIHADDLSIEIVIRRFSG